MTHGPSTIKLARHTTFLLRRPFAKGDKSLWHAEQYDDADGDSNNIRRAVHAHAADILPRAVQDLGRRVQEWVDIDALRVVCEICQP